MVIYIDVLFLINFYVTYFQVLAVSAFTHKNISLRRKAVSAAIGGLFSFCVFLPADAALLSALLRVAACFSVAFSAFGFGDFFTYLKNTVFLLFVNFIFAGIMLAVWLFFAPMGMIYSNGAVYFDIDMLVIIIATAAAYFLLKFIRLLFDKNGRSDEKYIVNIRMDGKDCTLSALSDTANGLVDYFSGLPIIICKKELCREIFPVGLEKLMCGEEYDECCSSKIRIIPFSTVSGSGYVYAFKAERVTIRRESSGKETAVDAMIGISDASAQEYGAIFNPKIMV